MAQVTGWVAREYTIFRERCVFTKVDYFYHINSNWKTLHSIGRCCIAVLHVNILTSYYLIFRLFLQIRKTILAFSRNVRWFFHVEMWITINYSQLHEKSKVHGLNDTFRPIPHSIVKLLKSCYEICKKRKGHIDSKDYKVRKNIYKEI